MNCRYDALTVAEIYSRISANANIVAVGLAQQKSLTTLSSHVLPVDINELLPLLLSSRRCKETDNGGSTIYFAAEPSAQVPQ